MKPFGKALHASLVSALLAWPHSAEANGPPIHGDTAFVVGIEGAGIRSFYQKMRMGKLLQDGNEVADPQGREMTVRMVPLMLPYEAIPNRLLIGFIVPYLDKRMESRIGGQRTTLTNRGGRRHNGLREIPVLSAGQARRNDEDSR